LIVRITVRTPWLETSFRHPGWRPCSDTLVGDLAQTPWLETLFRHPGWTRWLEFNSDCTLWNTLGDTLGHFGRHRCPAPNVMLAKFITLCTEHFLKQAVYHHPTCMQCRRMDTTSGSMMQWNRHTTCKSGTLVVCYTLSIYTTHGSDGESGSCGMTDRLCHLRVVSGCTGSTVVLSSGSALPDPQTVAGGLDGVLTISGGQGRLRATRPWLCRGTPNTT
jgi:hypothetical protein